MKKILLILTLALATTFSFAQGNSKIERGERPPIDLSKVPSDAYEAGKVRVKFSPTAEKSIPDVVYTAKSNGFVTTGIKSIDNLNQEFGAVTFTPLLNGYYEKSENNSQFRERHKAWGFHLWFTVEVNSKADVKEMVKKYSALPEVEYAEPIYKKRLIGHVDPTQKPNLSSIENNDPENKGAKSSKWTPNDPGYSSQWHYHNTGQQGGTPDKDIDLPEAWDIEKGSSSVIVAVIDGGIQTNHPDISANMWSGKGYNFVNKSYTLSPHDHGTHVAGTIAAVTNNNTGLAGIAGGSGSGNGVRLMSCQVFTNTSSGGFDQASIYAADNGAAISQNSWGYTSVNVYEQAVLDAIDYFNANGGGNTMTGGITIYAAGNDNATGNWYPGCYSGSFAVAATNNKDVKSYYSNYGTWINISAPGGEQSYSNDPKGIYSTVTNNGYVYMQGTSMACPHVSGVAALLVSNAYRNGLKLTRAQVSSLMSNNTDNHYALNSSYTGRLGSGRLNAHKALVALQSMFGGSQVPSVPTNLSTTNITATSATLNWSAVSGATSYDIQFRQQGGTWNTSNVTGTSANATNLTAGATYEWQIRANNSYGSSSYSAVKTFVTSQSGGVNYCESKGNNYSYEWISKVVVGSFSNTSQAAGYTDFTSKTITLEAGLNYNISLTPGYGSSAYPEYWKIWIDLNGDGDFDDANELVFDAGGTSNTVVNGTITIPAGTTPITTRMRVSMKYNGAPTACETFSYGEVEDYTVVIVGSTSDTQPPTAPTGLTYSNLTETSVSLSWNASTDNVGVTGYDVYKDGSLLGSVTQTSANITGLVKNTSYSFYVKAKDAAGNISSASSTLSVTTPGGSASDYCESGGSNYSYEWIAKVQVGTFTNASGAAGYTDFTSKEISLEPGSTANIILTPGHAGSTYPEYWKIWIDFNNDKEFSANELVFDAGSASRTAVSGTISIPANATGSTRMRVSMKYNSASTACETFSYGEVEDYTVVFSQSGADTQPPTTPTGLTASNITSSSAQLSWNASTDNVGVTGYDVYMNGSLLGSVTTNTASITSLSAGTTYSFYVKAKDAAGNVSGASNTYSLTTAGGTLTYCSSKGNSTAYEWIDLVQLNQINNITSSNGGYGNFTNLTATVARGSSQTIYFSAGFSGNGYTEHWHVWIDWNQNGIFDANERMVYGTSTSSGTLYATFTVPYNAVLGTTRMRVSMKYNAAATPCETFGYGEVEDYTINVVQSSTYQNNVNPIAETLGFESKDLYTIYPNPANDFITVSLDGIEGEVSVRIYDVQGRLVKDKVLNNSSTQLDISNLSKGVYIISVDEERMPINKRFVKL